MYDTVIVGGGAAGDLCPDQELPADKVINAASGAVAAIAIDVDLLLSDVIAGRDPAVSSPPRRTSDREGDST